MADRLLSAVLPTTAKRRRLVSRIIDGARRLVRGACAACCGPGSGVGQTLYAKACPCYTFPDEVYSPIDDIGDCAMPEGDCIYIDLRSVLADEPATSLAARFWPDGGDIHPDLTQGPTVIVGGVCYRFGRIWELYCDPALTDAELLSAAQALGLQEYGYRTRTSDIPDGGSRAGGNGVELPVAVGVSGEGGYSACSEEAGCSPFVNSGADFYEAHACDGGTLGQRLFVCSRASWDGNVLSGCLCIDRSVAFTAGEVAALEIEAGATLHTLTPDWLPVWAHGLGEPQREPAQSCCFCLATCMTGWDWTDFGGAGGAAEGVGGDGGGAWWPIDVCCGAPEDIRYEVELTYVRTLVQTVAPGDVITTTVTAAIDTVTDLPGGGSLVAITLTQRVVRPAFGTDETTTSPAEVILDPVCCLPYSGLVPSLGGLAVPETPETFTDGWDATVWNFYQQVVNTDGAEQLPPVGNDVRQAQLAWNESPWAAGLPLNAAGGGGAESEEWQTNAVVVVEGTCTESLFRLAGTYSDPVAGRSDTIDLELRVRRIGGERADCGWSGPCGRAGWGAVDLEKMMP